MRANQPLVYHLRPAWRLWAGLCLGAGILGFLLLIAGLWAISENEAATSDEVGPPVCAAPILILLLFFLLRYAINLLTTRLVVSTRGLEYQSGRVYVRASWREVQSLCVVKWHRRWLVDGIWVRQQQALPTPAIPVALFDPAWPHGPLGAALQQRAPHLFASPQTAPPGTPAPRRRRRRKSGTPPAELGDTRVIPPQSVYNRGQPDPAADPPGAGVDTIRF